MIITGAQVSRLIVKKVIIYLNSELKKISINQEVDKNMLQLGFHFSLKLLALFQNLRPPE